MTIGKEINGYPKRSYTYGNQNSIKNGQSESGCVPWQRAIMHYKKYEVSAQLMNIKYGSYAFTEQNMKSPMTHIAFHSKPIFILIKLL